MAKIETKEQFLLALKSNLRKLPQSDIDDAVEFYDEYITDSGESMDVIIKKLGHPREIALQLMSEKIYEQTQTEPPSATKGVKAILLAVLAIFASPIALPVAGIIVFLLLMVVFVVIMVLGAVVIAIGTLLVTFAALAVCCIITGIVLIGISIPVFIENILAGFFMLGAGLFMMGLGAVATIATIYIGKFTIFACKGLFGKLLPRMFRSLFRSRKRVAVV